MWAGEWWDVNLDAGQTVTVDWTDVAPATGYYQMLLFPPFATDANIQQLDLSQRSLYFSNSNSGNGNGTFTARDSGLYPLIIGDGCPSTDGPFQFQISLTG
jgi:hypothetical protein